MSQGALKIPIVSIPIIPGGGGAGGSGPLVLAYDSTVMDVTLGDVTVVGVRDTSVPRTLTLPSAALVAGRVYIVMDETGGAAANFITVATEGAEKINPGNADTLFIRHQPTHHLLVSLN